ncbi:hypothetical protein ACFOD9_13115 [Novosphingobium bradum]|uniref:Uncharacterized protein n=1 Tax=Novosphingobium bradum TaxID=1737444 RepID=A0ABV7IS93_9SPHN
MALDIIARAMATAARTAAASAANPVPIGRFADLPTRSVDAAWSAVITSGYAATGFGRGVYVADAVATGALAAAHPRFCKADAAGRMFRLLPDDNGLIPVACAGANGQSVPITNASVDDRAAIQAAEDYKHAIGAAGLSFDARYYAIRRTPRTNLATADIHTSLSGLTFVANSSTRWKSTHPQGSTLLRRKVDGTAYDKTDKQTIAGVDWRGGFLFMEGQTSDPGDPSVGSLILEDMTFDGGLRLADGLTFEICDKAVWQSNDRFCGHITLAGRTRIIGFTSELVYGAQGTLTSAADRIITVGPGVEIGETGGSCLNPNGQTLRVDRCLLYNAYIGIEGWTGRTGGYLKAVFRDITHGNSLQGGVASGPPLTYYVPNAPAGSPLPLGHLDIVLERAARFDVGSWITGRILAIDTPVAIGSSDVFVNGAEMVDLDIISTCDRAGLPGGVSLIGGGNGAMNIRNVTVRLDLKRSAYAVANNFWHQSAVYTYGSIGPNVVVALGANDGGASPIKVAAAAYDWGITVKGWSFIESGCYTPDSFWDVEAGNGGTLPNNRPVIAFTCSGTATGAKNVNLPTVKVNPGTRMFVANYTRNSVNPGLSTKVNGSNFRTGIDEVLPTDYTVACFEFTGSKWRVVERV